MKSKLNVLSVVASALFLLASCAPAYVPNVLNVPMLTNKGEVQVAAHLGTSGIDPQFAYAITNHLGIIVNGSFMNNTSETSNSYHKHGFGEAGLGYLKAIGSRGKFETFAGFGKGTIQADYENSWWTDRSNVNINRFFIQPTIGLTSKILDIGLSARFSFVDIYDESKNKVSEGFFEPAVTAKLGWDHLKVVGQLGISAPFNSEESEIKYQPFLFSLGIQGNFGKVFK